MGNVDKIQLLHNKEQEALEKYEETQDVRYLRRVKRYLDERIKLVNMRTTAFAPAMEILDEKER